MKYSIQLFLALVFCGLLETSLAHATIERLEGAKCNNVLVVHQGRADQIVEVFRHFSDLSAQSVAVSGSGVTASIVRRHNGFDNMGRGFGNIGSVEIRFNVSGTAATGNRTVTLKNAEGQAMDSFTVRVIARANITNTSVPSLSGPFHTVDVTLDGDGLSSALATVDIKRDQPLRDAAGQDIPGSQQVFVFWSINPQTNSTNRVVVTLNFTTTSGGSPIDLTQATVEIGLRSRDVCSGLYAPLQAFASGPTISRTVTISAPLGPNYVQDAIFDRNNKTYKIGDVVSVTIRLNRPVSAPRIPPIGSGIGLRGLGEKVFWTLLPSNAFEQAGPTGTPFDANAHHNTITIPNGNQTGTITFKVKSCPGSGLTNTVRLVTWKPDAFNDTSPNRKEFSFTIDCRP